MITKLSKEEITQELLAIVKENTVSSLPVNQLAIRSHHSTNFLHFEFVDDFSYMVSNETIFFSTDNRELEDDIFIIDCYYKEGFLDFEKYFNITGKETIVQFLSRVYDEVHTVYNFAYGKEYMKQLAERENFVKRPTVIDDVIFYSQYDGDNFCFLSDILGCHTEHHFEVRLYPVINLQKRTIEIDYYIVSLSNEYDNYKEALDDLWRVLVLSKIDKQKDELTTEDSIVIQMLNV